MKHVMPHDISTRYGREGDVFLVEVRLKEPRQLFHSMDPSPFREKDLDKDAEAYIVESVQDLQRVAQVKLVVYLPEPTEGQKSEISDAIRNYFTYRVGSIRRELRETLSRGRFSLAIGVVFLVCCILLRGLVPLVLLIGQAGNILQEGLLISGWVAMWYPIQVFLYDWWPILRAIRTHERIVGLPIEIRSLPM